LGSEWALGSERASAWELASESGSGSGSGLESELAPELVWASASEWALEQALGSEWALE
jgi:hypothetical protein